MFPVNVNTFAQACFIRRISVASNATQTIDNEVNLIKFAFLIYGHDKDKRWKYVVLTCNFSFHSQFSIEFYNVA